MEKIWTARIKEEDLPCTVGEAMKRLAGLSAHQIRSAKFRANGITVDGEAARVTGILREGCILRVSLEDTEPDRNKVVPVQMPLHILYEDEDILAVHKDAGMPVHPSHGHYDDTLANAAAWYLKSDSPVRTVGRLDADTSGIVVLAKNKVACERLSRQGMVQKTYYALAFGHIPEQMDITMPLRKMPGELNKMETLRADAAADAAADASDGSAPDGWLRAVTHAYRKEKGVYNNCPWSLARVQIETGRTHQIRAHMAGAGYPLLGDPIYGEWEDEMYRRGSGRCTRALLHCGKVVFRQPFTGAETEIDDPLPEDIRVFI